MRYVREETVHAPAERVWPLLVDVAGWPAWTESMREITRLDAGPLAVGSRSRVTQPGLSFEAVHRIDDAGDHVRTTLEFAGSGPLGWLGFLVAGSRIRCYLDMESAGLKRAAEAG